MHQRRLGAVMGRASPDELYDTVVSLVRRFTTRHSPGEVATPEGILPIDGENSQVPPSGGFQGNGTLHHNRRRPRFRLVKVGAHGADMRRTFVQIRPCPSYPGINCAVRSPLLSTN